MQASIEEFSQPKNKQKEKDGSARKSMTLLSTIHDSDSGANSWGSFRGVRWKGLGETLLVLLEKKVYTIC